MPVNFSIRVLRCHAVHLLTKSFRCWFSCCLKPYILLKISSIGFTTRKIKENNVLTTVSDLIHNSDKIWFFFSWIFYLKCNRNNFSFSIETKNQMHPIYTMLFSQINNKIMGLFYLNQSQLTCRFILQLEN